MTIKQSVLNTFKRVGIDHQAYLNQPGPVTVYNRFSGDSCQTSPLVAHLINWVYGISNEYERGEMRICVADFDRVRYFILDADSNAYMTCID